MLTLIRDVIPQSATDNIPGPNAYRILRLCDIDSLDDLIEQDDRDGATRLCQAVLMEPPQYRTLSHSTSDDTETRDSFRMMKSIVSSRDGPFPYRATDRSERPNNAVMLNQRKVERVFRIH
jgi:hypothetical protein